MGGTPIPAKALVPAKPKTTAVTKPAVDDTVADYLDAISPASIVGRMIKFSKDATFVTPDDGSEVSPDQDFIALCDETWIGFVKFNGPGNPPDRIGGLLYDGYVLPERASLGDTDQSQWEIGLDGQPDDPQKHHMYLVLQQADTRELFTFVAGNKIGRRAVGNLLRHYNRLRRSGSDEVPVVRLRKGGYPHKDDRVGWVDTPVFVVFGKTPRDGAAKPDTSTGGVLGGDSIPL
jgi:hypothetical protein